LNDTFECLVHRFDISAAKASGFVNAAVKFYKWVVVTGAQPMKAIDVLSDHPLEAARTSERF
jgi:hypothetical protein